MQKLGGLKGGDRGSALVGAVAICAVLGIGIAGLLGILRNTVGQESASYDDAEAFLAAESGLLMVVDWVMTAVNGDGPGGVSDADALGMTMRGGAADSIPVTMGVERPEAEDMPDGVAVTDNHLKLHSAAIHPNLPYGKRLEWIVALIPPDTNQTDDQGNRVSGGKYKMKKIGWREVDKPK
jgi:hypothetical protein